VSVNTSPKSVQRIKGRWYKIECDKRHRPAQIHKNVNVELHEGEVTDDNVNRFALHYVDIDLSSDVARHFEKHVNMTYNDMIGVLLEVATKHPDEIQDMLVVLGHTQGVELPLAITSPDLTVI
jgi:hypothetical protein